MQIKHHLFSQEGEHLLRAPQGQLHPNNSGEHEPQLGQLVAQVDGVERAEQLGVVDGEEEDGAGEAQGKTAEAKTTKQNKVKYFQKKTLLQNLEEQKLDLIWLQTRQGGGTSRGA